MSAPRSLSQAIARRFLVLRHLLAPARSLPDTEESVLAVVDRLGSLQFDPLEVAGRNHDLVLHARVAGYRRPWTDHLLYDRRLLFEAYNKGLSILPTRELPWHRLTWDRARRAHEGETFRDHGDHVVELLERIRRDGPISTADLDRSEAIDWYWGPTLKSRAVLEALAEAGILGIARREGNRRYYDLAERLFPAGLLQERVPEREQILHRLLSRYRAHGLLGATGQAEIFLGLRPVAPVEDGSPHPRRAPLLAELVERGELLPVAIEGIRGVHHVVTDELPLLAQAEREVADGTPAGRRPADRHVPRPARPAGLGPQPAAVALRVRLPLGGVRAGRQAALGLLRPAAPLSATSSSAGSSRATSVPRARCASSACGGRTSSTRSPRRGSCRHWRRPSRPTAPSTARREPRSRATGPPGRSRVPSRARAEPAADSAYHPTRARRVGRPGNQHIATQEVSMAAIRTAEVTWTGSLAEGQGSIDYVTSGAFTRLPVTWASRTEAADGRTSPEELLASAHASCYSMSLSGKLGRNGTPPASLKVTATVTFDKGETGWGVVSSALAVRGNVPGIDAADVRRARRGCQGRLPDQPGAQGQRGPLRRGHPRGVARASRPATPARGHVLPATRRGAARPVAPYPAMARIRRGFSTVIRRISSSPTPRSRSRGRNVSWRYV